jgi:hypothetical protein
LTNCVADASTALGVFAQARTGMPSATTIYYRGYATNGVGTGYSPVSSFVTLAVAVACTGLPSDASYHPGDDPGVLGNSTAAYSATNNAPYCEFICGTGAGGYTWSGGVCRPPQINYFRICDDAAGTIGCVNPSDPAKSVNVGDTVYTHWDSSYTDECNASAGPADFSTSLQTTGVDSNVISAAPGTPQTYSVRCTKNLNAVSSSNRTITININLLNPTLTSSQSVVKVGSSVTLTWDSNNTPAGVNEGVCGLTGGGLVGYNPLPVGGDLEMGTTNPITISGRTTFTLTCPSGTAIKTVDVIPQNGET